MAAPTRADFLRFGKLTRGEWPLPIPDRVNVRCDSDIHEFEAWLAKQLTSSVSNWVAIDTEYGRDSKVLELIGMGSPGGEVIQIAWGGLGESARTYVVQGMRELLALTRVVVQNFMADLPVLEQNLGLVWADYRHGIDDTMLAHAVLFSDWPHDLEFLASLYSSYDKMKHLSKDDPELYNQGDVLDTIAAWQSLSANLAKDPESDRVYRDQSLALVPILLEVHPRGIRVNKDRIGPAIADYEARLQWARQVGMVYSGIPTFNIGSGDQMKWWLYAVEGMPEQKNRMTGALSVDEDSIAVLRQLVEPVPDVDEEREQGGLTLDQAITRIHAGAHPLLEARVVYMAAQQVLSHYLYPCCVYEGRGKKRKVTSIRERIYPQFKIHAQASGRWSTTNPPLAQLPLDLRDIICPDEGWSWIGFDWSNIERRNLQALTGSKRLKEIFDNGWDMHTLTMCDVFGYEYPPDRRDPDSVDNAEWSRKIRWSGKDDIRRTFAKRFSYRLDYGGEPKSAGGIPGAKQLQLTPEKLIAASNRYLKADPDYSRWRLAQARKAVKDREVRTSSGRRRLLLGDERAAIRESYNHPNQGGVADVFNLTVVRIANTIPGVHFVYGMHDSQIWAVRSEDYDAAREQIQAIAEREWEINGQKVIFPASFKERVDG
jgi:DNA polymerase I-like protein with 3'-5' exonuclease and polymerase domains